MGAFKDFDAALAYGQAGEQWFLNLGAKAGDTVEVKRECFRWKQSGNLFFEHSCNGIKSGLAYTKANWWVHILDDEGETAMVFIFNVARARKALNRMVKEGKLRPAWGVGDGGRVNGYLLPISLAHELK